MKRPTSPHEAIVEPSGGPVYEGAPGKTRTEEVHLVQPDGSLAAVPVYRGVNVQTDPKLKARVLAGQLHRLPDGRELALPFVYHDPQARRFALVIPPVLAHLEMKEWTRLMAEIAEDTRCSVPAYVRDCTTVVGLGALELFLEGGVEPDDEELEEVPDDGSADTRKRRERAQAVEEQEQLLEQREREVAEQEANLIRMAESLTSREGTLNRREERLTTALADLEAREQELTERENQAQPVADEAPGARVEWHEVGDEARSDEVATVVAEMPSRAALDSLDVQDSEVEDLSSAPPPGVSRPPPLRTRPGGGGPPPLRTQSSAAAGGPPPLRPGAHDTAAAARVQTQPPPLPSREAGGGFEPPVQPPLGFEALPPGRMAVRVADDEVWVFAALRPEQREELVHGTDLLLQYVEHDGHPVALLTLLGPGDEPWTLRVALDGRREADRSVIEHLARSFRVRVAAYLDGRFDGVEALSSLRESVAAAVLERIEGARRREPATRGTLEAVLAAPPPARRADLPFGPARPHRASVSYVLAAVERLDRWTRPAELEQATLTYGIPRHVIEASSRRVLRVALTFGVALPERLEKLAVTYGVAPDRPSLARQSAEAFRRRLEDGDCDLDTEAAGANWRALLAQAERAGVTLPPELAAMAEASSQEPAGQAGAGGDGMEQLLSDPERRLWAIQQLCERRQKAALSTLLPLLDELAPHEVAIAVPHLLRFGEDVGDGLVRGLESDHEPVRHACALGLGRLRLRRTLVALLKQLDREPGACWPEMARALGDFGAPALRGVARALERARRPERVILALSHLANHGCLAEVENLESDPDTGLALAARQALARRSALEWEDQAVREQRPLRNNTPEARFSQAFFAEAARLGV